jgi:hypothetical protein
MVSTRKQKLHRPNQDEAPPLAPKSSVRRTARVKNKVASPQAKARAKLKAEPSASVGEVSSDEFNFSDEEAQAEEDQTTAYASDSSQASGTRERLPRNVQRALLIEIQKQGGIDKFDQGEDRRTLQKICDKTPSLFGARGSQLRLKVTKKVVRWRSQHKQFPLKWIGLLSELGVETKDQEAAVEETAEKLAPASPEKPATEEPTTTTKKPATAPKKPTPEVQSDRKPAAVQSPKPAAVQSPKPAAVQSPKPAAMSNSKPSKC